MNQVKIGRLHALDSLRGLAALVVLLGHCALIATSKQIPFWLSFTPLRVFINGHASVILFFVLSGYVLSIPFMRGAQPLYASYIIKRICRIYIPFMFTILFAALLYDFSAPAVDQGSAWFRAEWSHGPLTSQIIWQHLAMTGKSDEIWLDGVMWSLVHEMRISIVFPLLIYLCRNIRVGVLAIVLFYSGAVAVSIATEQSWSLVTSDSLAGTFLITLRYIPFFMAGIILANNHELIQGWLCRLRREWSFGLLMIALLVLSIPREFHNEKILAMFPRESASALIKYGVEVSLGIASGFLIVFVRSVGESASPFNIFSMPAIQWLGKISYSLYLVHLPILLFLFRLLFDRISFFCITLLAIGTSIATASAVYLIIERPSMRLGKYLAESVNRPWEKSVRS